MSNTTKEYRHHRYEVDPAYNADAYTVKRHGGVAWDVLGWEVVADEDTGSSGCYNRTGQVLAVMVGDDHVSVFDPSDVSPLTEGEFCPGCGQIGCTAEGR